MLTPLVCQGRTPIGLRLGSLIVQRRGSPAASGQLGSPLAGSYRLDSEPPQTPEFTRDLLVQPALLPYRFTTPSRLSFFLSSNPQGFQNRNMNGCRSPLSNTVPLSVRQCSSRHSDCIHLYPRHTLIGVDSGVESQFGSLTRLKRVDSYIEHLQTLDEYNDLWFHQIVHTPKLKPRNKHGKV